MQPYETDGGFFVIKSRRFWLVYNFYHYTEDWIIMENNYLTYKGRPLVRCGNEMYYGSMSDKVELITECLKQSGFTDKKRTYMVGDRSYDMVGAAKTGVHSIGVTYGFGTRIELVNAGAEFTAYDPGNVVRILMEQAR